jgi:trimethylamine:corrinoid methyltransferase-like protein
LNDYEAPSMDSAKTDTLKDFIARRTAEDGALVN